jgi:tagatose-1,6-bisphosphate aldolase non-catalytic subunit AgaZ/GatZ
MSAAAPSTAARIRQTAAGRSLIDAIVQLLAGPLADAPGAAGRHTLLAVCPNSETVTRAALLAAQEANAPLLYAATLNQVDRDGGYTGWTPADLAAFVADEAERLGVDVPIVLGLDHGGPWKKDAHAQADLPYDETLAEVTRSLDACIDAGYELLHLDPTVDRRLPPGTPVPVDNIVGRTVKLLDHAEAYRKEQGRGPLAYEVGTEEAGGGLQTTERFAAFLDQLEAALDRHNLPQPSFVVGDVGTRLDTDHFNPVRAEQLTEQSKRIGALIKGHYTDSVAHPEAYPLSGMGGANVGPGLSAAEYAALMELVELEQRVGRDSGFKESLRTAVVDSGRWRKWRRPEESELPFDELSPERQEWLVETGSRYVWTHPDVEAAREALYANVAPFRDAEAFVTWRVKTAILRYYHAFNLIDFNDRLLEHLPAPRS